MTKLKMDNRAYRQAFTLVELVVVMIVIGVLAALVVPQFFSRIGQSRHAVAKQKIATISTAMAVLMTPSPRSSRRGLGCERGEVTFVDGVSSDVLGNMSEPLVTCFWTEWLSRR